MTRQAMLPILATLLAIAMSLTATAQQQTAPAADKAYATAAALTVPHDATAAALTIDDLQLIAMGNNPTLAQAARAIEALRGKHVQVGLRPNPVGGYVGDDINEEGRSGKQGAFFGQKIVTAGKLRLNRAVVGHEIVKASQEWEIQRRRVVNDVRVAAYTVLVAQRVVRLDEQLVRIGDEGLDVTEKLLRAMEVSRVDVLQARIEANSARLQLETARNEYQAAWRKLAALLGIPDMEPTPLVDRLEDDDPALAWETSLPRLLAGSPELASAQTEVERAKCRLARENAGRVPNFDVEAAARYDYTSENPVANIRMAVPLQIFNRNQGNIRRAHAELRAARQEVRRVELSLQDRLAGAFKQHLSAKEQVGRYREQILPDAKDSLELVGQGYRQGEFGYLELLTSQRTYFRVSLAYEDALLNLWVSNAQINGMLLSGGLQQPGTR